MKLKEASERLLLSVKELLSEEVSGCKTSSEYSDFIEILHHYRKLALLFRKNEQSSDKDVKLSFRESGEKSTSFEILKLLIQLGEKTEFHQKRKE